FLGQFGFVYLAAGVTAHPLAFVPFARDRRVPLKTDDDFGRQRPQTPFPASGTQVSGLVLTNRADDRLCVLIVAGWPASMTFLCLLLVVLTDRCRSRILFLSSGSRLPFFPRGLGRVIGRTFLLFLFRSLAKKHTSDFLDPNPAVLKYLRQL